MSFSHSSDSDESDVTDDSDVSSYDGSSGSTDSSESRESNEEIQFRVNVGASGSHSSTKRKIPNISASHSNKRRKLDHGSKHHGNKGQRQQKKARKYCTELLNVIKGRHRNELMEDLEDKMKKSFENDQRHNPRQAKNCFNYLLLDPRITKDLPKRELLKKNQLRAFLKAIFYIGKGTRTRPYAHLQEAKQIMENRAYTVGGICWTEKIQRIADIWSAGHGVISLACFQNVTGQEALTREACMLEAIGLDNVTNVVNGTLYGGVENWPEEERQRLGAHLLHSAYYILINEGESHIRPSDL